MPSGFGCVRVCDKSQKYSPRMEQQRMIVYVYVTRVKNIHREWSSNAWLFREGRGHPWSSRTRSTASAWNISTSCWPFARWLPAPCCPPICRSLHQLARWALSTAVEFDRGNVCDLCGLCKELWQTLTTTAGMFKWYTLGFDYAKENLSQACHWQNWIWTFTYTQDSKPHHQWRQIREILVVYSAIPPHWHKYKLYSCR